MSLSICIFFSRSACTVLDWQNGINTLDLPLILDGGGSLGSLGGYLPAQWSGKEAGFECCFGDANEPDRFYDEVDLGGPWLYAMELFYCSFSEAVGAAIGAAGLAQATGGVVYEPEEDTVFDIDGAAKYARELIVTMPELEARFERGEF